ncbi:MAG: hypothetical protein U1F61_06755 [Opitutaceae bacterium]
MTQETSGSRTFAANGANYVIKVAFLPNGHLGPHAWYVVAFSTILFGEDVPLAGPFLTKREAVGVFWADYSGADDTFLSLQVLGARNELQFGA